MEIDGRVLPGDDLPESQRYGPGVEYGKALVAGTLQQHGQTLLIRNNFKRYTPAPRDMVIGIVHQKVSDIYRVQLQPKSKPVRLDQLAFENATRKNKPNLVEGDVVYARVKTTDPGMEQEIECVDSKTGKSTGFGQLKGGTLISVGLGFARQLLFEGHPILEQLGQKYSFEIAIGVNGRIWIKTNDTKATLDIIKHIEEQNSLA